MTNHPQPIDPYYTTKKELIERKLDLLDLQDGDFLCDLGSGDGRALIAGCERADTKAVGYEILDEALQDAAQNIEIANLTDRIELQQENFYELDLSGFNTFVRYLTRNSLGGLSEKLENELKSGTRIVTETFDILAWTYKEKETGILSDGSEYETYLYIVD
ncbi:MAG: precorrin-6B methylase 2 [Crocinitomicaceae bacterium]|jgi:precorrin-6B methylase 2